MDIRELLKVMVDKQASDLYLTADLPAMYRIEGVTQPIGSKAFTNEDLEGLCTAVLRDKQRKEFEDQLEMNLALYYPGLGRFRANLFRQRGNVGFVIRHVKSELVPMDKLGLPGILKDIAMTRRGLVLVVGAAGTGKSTTLAAMIDHRNETTPGHIVTLEDQIGRAHV